MLSHLTKNEVLGSWPIRIYFSSYLLVRWHMRAEITRPLDQTNKTGQSTILLLVISPYLSILLEGSSTRLLKSTATKTFLESS